MRRWLPRALPLLAAATLIGCENELPTAVDDALVPVGPVTLEVRVPWSQFASNLRVIGGFGAPYEVGRGFLADGYAGVLHARTLLHFNPFPTSATLPDSLGTTRTDSDLSFRSGRLLLTFDTLASTNTGPVSVTAARTLTSWDARSTTWELAIDTPGVRVPWDEAGGGPVEPLGTATWEPVLGDTVYISLDSAAVAALGDTTAVDRGVRLSVGTPGQRLQINAAVLELVTRSSINPDTLLILPVGVQDVSFIYTPHADPPASGMRVGGVPAWRTILDLDLPETVPGTPEACARVTCPLELTPERITHAALVLTTTASSPAFQPTDTFSLDLRGVLAPEALPKSPLDQPLYPDAAGRPFAARVAPSAFHPGAGRAVDVPITPLVRALLRDAEDGGRPATPTIALLSVFCPPPSFVCREPQSISFATFAGAGEPGEPFLRLLLTISDRVELP